MGGGAGEGNRTLGSCLGSKGITIIRRPLWAQGQHSKRRTPPGSIFLKVSQLPVLAGVKKKRCQGRGFSETLDPADENGVVAASVGGFVGDFEGRAATGEYRRTANTRPPGQADKTVDWPSGEAVGDVLLINRQNIDGVMAGPAESFKIVRGVVETPQDQRRFERNGGEGIDGQPDRVPIRVYSRNNGDAGGKAPEGVT